MRIDFVRAGLAGLAGTVAFDLVGLILGRGWWDIPQLLGMKLGGGLGMGVLAHYINGVLIAAIFAGIAPSLWGSRWARALLFMTVQTVFGVGLFMMPLLDMGIMGLNAGLAMPVVGMMRHWAYGVVVAWLYPLPEAVLQGRSAGAGARAGSTGR
ncbi:hypothetical protein [Limnochorda pilosa]|uniref:Uncharacterized protein n=1 Tax=Limnochorda pilosa TaxID=1555112 RepID=A0A0K2SQW6_LIMPI|nr:hypothetical protein [Limnochorda pilosa]BAS29194.1 hypothetical protein LIP_3382 [Limnochorda pilosa]